MTQPVCPGDSLLDDLLIYETHTSYLLLLTGRYFGKGKFISSLGTTFLNFSNFNF